MKLTKQEIGAVLRRLREQSGFTQKEVAEHFGRKQQIVGHWETGYSQPDAGTLFELCDFYGADISKEFGFNYPQKLSVDSSISSLTAEDLAVARAYHCASEDDRAVVDAALRKYYDVTTVSKGDAEKMA